MLKGMAELMEQSLNLVPSTMRYQISKDAEI
jgi:hypothetical protein